ncbi:rhamnogalacturonan endolyase [Mucilaginibacter yixingensis]|uniref:Rhamnogalacturonan endolyase n=1 Tax=Mucilaginibacter yixingensis TaxID=1295612 RepID=A0A2T5JBK6_9SPHI|nr:rhamnogalacturonan lyase [Mucilaginibacter yixingensis]PTQ98244.1 rhamnogalacturonan endolyase [Mucilaginibacter yixingensis]
MRTFTARFAGIAALLLFPAVLMAQRPMEYLGRGVVAIHQTTDSVFVSWRVLGTDPAGLGFNLYRQTGKAAPVKLNQSPITGATIFSDIKPDFTQTNAYFVRPVDQGKEQEASKPFVLPANAPVKPYLSVPLKTPNGYQPNDVSVADLDGDGEYEIILHQAGRGHDNSQGGFTDSPILQAYKLDGTLLWTINLGKNIREGAHYTQFMVYDLDGDGRAEVACKTADGTIDGQGNVIGDSTKDWRNDRGYILAGPEYLTIFNGMTGKAMATTNFVPARYPDNLNPTSDQLKEMWGDGYGNRMDRFLAAIAYLDGKHPSLIMSRGYYTRTFVTAWDWKDGKLTKRWAFDSKDKKNPYSGQGNHNLSITDVDGDGKDEIIYGAMTLDDDGKGLYTTGIGHADALHVGDLDPDRPGLEVFDTQERFSDAGANFRDARTGEVIWKKASVKAGEDGEGPGRALALNIDPRYRGSECWVAGAGLTGIWDAKGNKISEVAPPCNFGIFWDGDLQSELLNGTNIMKWDYQNSKTISLLNARNYDCASNNGTKANPCLSADILGDWREEAIYRTTDGKELRIFVSTIPTTHRLYTFMHDPQYRLSIAWQNVAYNQPPHTSFYMGDDMTEPPKPNIILIKYAEKK